MADAVILIPGLFGFGRFGAPPTILECFAGVKDELVRAAPELAGRILVHEPPPTGSIDERVATLHEAVRSVLVGRALRNNTAVRAERIHLVGHSAGGVDARLYANSGFSWVGGPHDDERREALSALGRVVTLSSPHSGTPIATNAVFGRDALLFGVYLMSVLGRHRRSVPAAVLVALGALSKRLPASDAFGALLRLSAGLDAASLSEVRRFFAELVDDRQLMRDLTTSSLGGRTAGLRATDHPDLQCFVSVAPPPRRGRVHAAHAVERFLYRVAYEATARGVVIGETPSGPGLGGRVAERLRDPCPNDGVVPASSQTVDGVAAGVVEGDHLDVVGHFMSGPGVTVLKSDAAFDRSRFRALWSHIASVLVAAPAILAEHDRRDAPRSFPTQPT